jgi:hypothetical protein
MRCHTLPGVRGVYNRYEYFKEKKAALEGWADFLGRLTGTIDNVVKLDKHRKA